jgi:cell division protein FtsI/penicillin-binding protein 2
VKRDRRIFQAGLFYFCIFILFIGRLVYIQLIGTESFSDRNVNLIQASIDQRTQSFVLNEGRGQLLGRDGELLMSSYHYGLVLFPFLKHSDWPVKEIASIIGVDKIELNNAVNRAEKPFEFEPSRSLVITKEQMKAVKELGVPGVYVQPIQSKNVAPFARHFIGAIGENPKLIKERYPEKLEKGIISDKTKIGIMGIQEAFDPFLLSRGESKFVYHTERSGAPLFGLDVKYAAPANPYYPIKVKTTLDRNMQQVVEEAVQEAELEQGGAILLDAENSNLLAMASRPLFDPDQPYKQGGKNHTILPQIPGSVFKIVTAAAAIEKNKIEPGRHFNCDLKLQGEGGAKRELGKLTFEQSFVQSCNFTFGKLSNELIENDRDFLETYAKKLGLTETAGWSGSVYHIDSLEHFPNELEGKVWRDESYKNEQKSVAQTAIGQLNVRVSPLEVANMIATIARGGEKLSVRAATEVIYENGIELVSFPKQVIESEAISPYTAMTLRKLLRDVVKSPEGTGHRMLSDLPYPVAGKSGTAETGDSKITPSNQWFAGYFPADNPKYVLVVVDLDRQDGEMKTYHIYQQIVKELYESDTANH